MNDDTKKYDSLTNYEVIIYMAFMRLKRIAGDK